MIPLKPLDTNSRTLELYSTRRNRNIYPNPSSFEVNFSPTVHPHCGEKVVNDPVCKGGIYYTFQWEYQKIDNVNYIPFASGKFGLESTQSNPVLLFTYSDYNYRNNIENLSKIDNYFVSFLLFRLEAGQLTEYKTIQKYDATSGKVILDRPFKMEIITDSENNGFVLFSNLPFEWVIDLPTIDINGNPLNNSPLYYNGYYVVFETPNTAYSNSSNSNIFSRRISYYDSDKQQAYLEQPLPFTNYYDFNPYKERQVWTLRKSLPNERWTLDKPSYYKSTRSSNPIIGPLPGYVVILPDQASSVNNYYKGMYIYVVSNPAEKYFFNNLVNPINNSFFPIYGLFYITAYNGSTKEASIYSANNNKYINNINIPTYSILNSTFEKGEGCLEIIDVGGGTYQAYYDSNYPYYEFNLLLNLKKGNNYRITWSVKKVASDDFDYKITFYTIGGVYSYVPYDNDNNIIYLTNEYQEFTFDMTMSYDTDILDFIVKFESNPAGIDFYIEWNLLKVEKIDVINIVNLEYDNYSPLDYNGTMVSTNETVCYEMSIQSLTLPNKELLQGSIISFYPFVYVQIENATSPTKTSSNTLISNNPPSTKAVFTVYIPQLNNVFDQKFVTLYGGGIQIVKFKPNDNLRFSVYLPDGSPFETLIPDNLTPYPPNPDFQIQEEFSLSRLN